MTKHRYQPKRPTSQEIQKNIESPLTKPMKAEVDIKPFLKAINDFRIAEQQPCGVQVVEWVGLVARNPMLKSEHIIQVGLFY